jgi:hypothetical protein
MAVRTGTRVRSIVQQASAALLAPGVLAASMALKGSEALLFHRRDERECARRDARGAQRLDRITPLTTLLQLPVGEPVPLSSLTPTVRAAVHTLPRGAATVCGGTVRREAVRPLAVDLVVVRSRGNAWRDGLVRAGRFAPFARRALLVDPPAGQREDLVMEAAFYGVGLLFPTTTGAELVLEPRPYRPRRHTPTAWCFVEELYHRLSTTQA